MVFWLLFSQDKLTSFRLFFFSFLPSPFKLGFAVPTQNGTITSIPLNTNLSSLYLPLTSPQLNLILPVGSIFNVHKHETLQTIPPRCQIRHSLPCVHTHTHTIPHFSHTLLREVHYILWPAIDPLSSTESVCDASSDFCASCFHSYCLAHLRVI